MAQAQLQPQATKAAQGQAIKKEQSLGVIQCLLGASIGCLSFLRGLLPGDCFKETRYADFQSTLMDYRSFTGDESEDDAAKRPRAGLRVQRLRRGYSDEADRLLDWLELGVFDALSKSYLKAFQLAIFLDEKEPRLITESYTFSFSYDINSDGTPSPPRTLRVKDSTGREVAITDARKSFQQIVRLLITVTQNLPPLPDRMYLTMGLHYTDWTPPSYSPPYFRRLMSSGEQLRFQPELDRGELERHNCGAASTGHHAVSVRVSALVETDPIQRQSKRPRYRLHMAKDDIIIPPLHTPSIPVSTIRQETSQIMEKAEVNANHLPESGSVPSLKVHAKRNSKVRLNEGETYIPNDEGKLLSIPHAKGKEPSLQEEKVRAALHNMLHPYSPTNLVETQIDTETTTLSQVLGTGEDNLTKVKMGPARHISGKSASVLHFETNQAPTNTMKIEAPKAKSKARDQRLETTSTSAASVKNSIAKLKLSSSKLEDLERTKSRKPRKEHNNGKKGEYTESITCECGDPNEEYGMIACDSCNGWVHAHCYGYHSDKDERIPDYIACYTCLLDKEATLLEEMRVLCLYRRALKKVWDEGYPASNRLLAEALGCGLPTALDITKRLESEDFIANTTPLRGRNRPRKVPGPIKYEVVKTEQNRLRMEKDYFDPLVNISHHNLQFDLPMTSGSLLVRNSVSNSSTITGSPTPGPATAANIISASSTKGQKGKTIVPDSQKCNESTAPAGIEDEMDLDLDDIVVDSSKSVPNSAQNARQGVGSVSQEQWSWRAQGAPVQNIHLLAVRD